MNETKRVRGRIKFLCGGVLLAALTGCVVAGGYDGGPGYVGYIPGPEVAVFGGFHRGGFDRDASRRGAESRGVAHGGGRGGHR
jgi:hypothetical protein